ncbi:DUF4097 family beta strand repeat-containing protein [Streptomyces sp. NPDC006422]|uniref:DUF4097 family beta strand repeat-containing protein n=1 Tax=unclassified Streptomyces TaxID=2593676 RepID=UPI0033B10A73
MQKFDTPAAVSAVLRLPAGRVQVIAADRADTTVDVRPADPSKGRDERAAEQTAVTFADGVLRVDAPTGKNQLVGASGSVEITVQLPAGSRVEAVSEAVEFRGVGRLGEVVCETAHGTVKIDEAAGLRLASHAGDVTVGRLTGPADISVQKGDIRVTEATAGALELRTRMGDITVDAAPGVSATLDAGTGHGRIHNTLLNTEGAAAGLTIHASTDHGDITARGL